MNLDIEALKSKAKDKTVYLIDVSWILHRSYHTFGGMEVVINGVKRPTGHVFGIFKTIFDLKKQNEESLIILCLDSKENHRKEEENYKQGRDQLGFNIYNDLLNICNAALAVPGVVVAVKQGYEADDILYSLAKSLKGEALEVGIHSGDNDMLQALDDKIFIFRSIKGKNIEKITRDNLYEEPRMVDKFRNCPVGVLADYRAVVGDSSDNLKGVPRINRGWLVEKLKEVGSLEELFNYCKVATESPAQLLKTYRAEVEKNYQLMKLGIVSDIDIKSLERFEGRAKQIVSSIINMYELNSYRENMRKIFSIEI